MNNITQIVFRTRRDLGGIEIGRTKMHLSAEDIRRLCAAIRATDYEIGATPDGTSVAHIYAPKDAPSIEAFDDDDDADWEISRAYIHDYAFWLTAVEMRRIAAAFRLSLSICAEYHFSPTAKRGK